MSRRIDIELTSSREDGSWTWRAAGAREPKGTLEGAILPSGVEVGQVLRAEIEGYLDGLSIVAVLPPRTPRVEPQRLEIKSSGSDQPLVTSTLAPKRSGERGRRNDRGREGPGGGPRRDRDRRGGPGGPARERQESRHDRPSRPAPPPVEDKPKPKRLRPGRAHRNALLEAVPAEQRPIAEQLLVGGIPAVRQAIDKQNETLRAEGKPEVKPDALLKVAEDLRQRAQAAVWRDRAEAAAAVVDELDLRDLRSVVNAAGDAGRDEEARALATQLRESLASRVEKEHAAWLAELAETVAAGRVVRALRLSSRPPKAGAMIPGDVATQLAEATAASLTDETGPDRWATVLDALAYSPLRRRVIPQSLPTKLAPELRATIARLASRLPEIAHIFDIEPDPAAERAARGQARRRPGRKGDDRKGGDRKGGEAKGDRKRGDRKGGSEAKRDGGRDGRKGGEAKGGEGKGGKGKGASDTPVADTTPATAAVADPTTDEAPATEAPTTEATSTEATSTEATSTEATSTEAGGSAADAPQGDATPVNDSQADTTSAEAESAAPAEPAVTGDAPTADASAAGSESTPDESTAVTTDSPAPAEAPAPTNGPAEAATDPQSSTADAEA